MSLWVNGIWAGAGAGRDSGVVMRKDAVSLGACQGQPTRPSTSLLPMRDPLLLDEKEQGFLRLSVGLDREGCWCPS